MDSPGIDEVHCIRLSEEISVEHHKAYLQDGRSANEEGAKDAACHSCRRRVGCRMCARLEKETTNRADMQIGADLHMDRLPTTSCIE